jgi:hypothetical protein
MRLPQGEPHQNGRGSDRQLTAIEPRQYVNPISSFAHQHHTHRIRSLETSRDQEGED